MVFAVMSALAARSTSTIILLPLKAANCRAQKQLPVCRVDVMYHTSSNIGTEACDTGTVTVGFASILALCASSISTIALLPFPAAITRAVALLPSCSGQHI